MNIEQLLKSHYGFSKFRAGQREIISSILAGHDTLALMPTGGGKSLCFQLPALALPGMTLVISPLIALMKDQVDALLARGIAASFINSSLEEEEINRRTKEILRGKVKLLYVAPERLAAGFFEIVERLPIDLIAVDEAHCISSWGHDFRPDYLTIPEYIGKMPERPIVSAFTATATPEVKADIIKRLGLKQPNTFVRGFDRPNLRFFTRGWFNDYQRDQEILRLVRSLQGPGIIYCGTRDKTEELASFLSDEGIITSPYHAGMDGGERTFVQNEFMRGKVRVIAATIAFGMGVDKPDIRFVIHAHLPASLENYYQEAGRAGRDGNLAYCILLYGSQDAALHEYFIRKNRDESVQNGKSRIEATRVALMRGSKLRKMQEYSTKPNCRRKAILQYFGDETIDTLADNCRACDYCLNYQWNKVPPSAINNKDSIAELNF